MPDEIRSFVAIELPESIQRTLVEVENSLSSHISTSGVSWVKLGNIHLTLKFLGNVGIEKLEAISSILSQIASDFKTFELCLGKVGAFPSFSKANVIWIGIKEGQDQLRSLANRVETRFIDLGFEKDRKEFRPHVTIGRLRKAAKISLNSQLQSRFEDLEPTLRVASINLMKSELRSSGAVYTVLRQFPLK
jgi:2'-5' RNA ligase